MPRHTQEAKVLRHTTRENPSRLATLGETALLPAGPLGGTLRVHLEPAGNPLTPPSIPLTPEQQAVVAHDRGPALVFAVAGAGKTTSMVHRIERLVRDGVFPAERILATSFGRENVADLRRALSPWPHCRGVGIRTLHSLGRQVLVWAQEAGYLRSLRLDGREESGPEPVILNRALALARSGQVPYLRELDGLDRKDFLDYVDSCKGNLAYADLEAAELPAGAHRASQAQPPEVLDWYLDLYRLFERARRQRGEVTYADMLLSGWEALIRYPQVRERAQAAYRCLLVDEFQDINLAQSEMLDLITAPHRDYMAIGDDDQTIYQWRGAAPRFILDFPRRYGARRYLIGESFRSPAAPLVLANNVIAHNRRRQPKRLRLTRGFEGRAEVHPVADAEATARAIVEAVQENRKGGRPLNDMAILVRLNAQTPYIEQRLIAQDIPYRSSQPFYQRREIKTLVYYTRLAWFEQQASAGRVLYGTDTAIAKFREAWHDVYRRPKRYLTNDLRDRIERQALASGLPLSRVLPLFAHENERLADLADDLRRLAGALESDAHAALVQLEERLDYQDFLRRSSGFAQTGAALAAGVAAFIAYARGQGTLLEFMGQVRELGERGIGREAREGEDALTITTIHQAKGREWPVVFIPDCNEGILPFDPDGRPGAGGLEEERRLFYVALTRARQEAHLYQTRDKAPSRFLGEAGHTRALPAVEAARRALTKPPGRWTAEEGLALCREVSALFLDSYFQDWWPAPDPRKEEVAHGAQRFYAAAERHGLLRHLRLEAGHIAVWRRLAPLTQADLGDLPGLSRLIARPAEAADLLQGRARKGDSAVYEAILQWVEESALPEDTALQWLRLNPSAATTFLERRGDHPLAKPLAERLPRQVRPGTWVRCDAGWGVVTGLEDGAGKTLDRAKLEDAGLRLHLTLRPESEPEKVLVELGKKTITFLRARQVYACGECRHFASASSNLVMGDHGRAAHGRKVRSVRSHPSPVMSLSHPLECRDDPPEDELQ